MTEKQDSIKIVIKHFAWHNIESQRNGNSPASVANIATHSNITNKKDLFDTLEKLFGEPVFPLGFSNSKSALFENKNYNGDRMLAFVTMLSDNS